MIFRMIFFWLITISLFLSAQEGTLDTSFGNNGLVVTDASSANDCIREIAVRPSGKIIAGGYSFNGVNLDFAVARYNSDGSLDSSFGTNGIVTTNIANDDFACAVAIQNNGKILLAGSSHNGTDYDIAVVRYNTNGSLDSSFGNNGIVIITGIGSDTANGMDIQEDGKIVIAGNSSNGTDTDVAVVRCNSDGSLDTSFNGTGIVTTSVGPTHEMANRVAVQKDGKIVIAGRSYDATGFYQVLLIRYNIDGSIDTTFGTNGIVTTYLSPQDDVAEGFVIQPDGKLVICGKYPKGTRQDVLVIRYNTDGSLDTTFGTNGIVSTSVGASYDYGNSITIQRDNKLVVAGYTHNGANTDFVTLRYNTDGSLDNTFGTNGIATLDIASGSDNAYSVAIQNNGQIIVAGSGTNTNSDFVLLRYNGTVVTAIELLYFRAKAKGNHAIIEWKTASEVDNAGFHLWRSENKQGKYSKITESILPSNGGASWGARYSHDDFQVISGRTYYYKLQEIDNNGRSTFHGSVSVIFE